MTAQGRGGSTGYDNAIALPANPGQDELDAENNKNVTSAIGSAVFSVSNVRWGVSGVQGWLCITVHLVLVCVQCARGLPPFERFNLRPGFVLVCAL